ncbi:sigma-54-dependent Fis family transcriptional regulator [Virgisporangium aurantiacum]|uniref:Fis family transcriptional regulator n=1 Tax=Virgisporangium aurantiacum TaxID=175570 RepID=A0A8J3ZC58_9ACTN|nr:GAF domain-containing protein [Virgisporangium aurantiacum]GIJ61261.1 Fis family transcriptional regulator [Virgisporangium aurantiacum]
MVRPTRPGPAVRTNGDRLAEARERFLTSEAVEPDEVRDTILASWQRSRYWNVAADRIRLRYVRDPDLDSPLIRSALPVLRVLRNHLDGQPISVLLTDPAGLVLTRMTGDADLERHLDRVLLAPGFSYAEEWVGTNGIGTALEGGRPMHVFGHEHYAENLENLACAAAPIHHPITGKTVGAVNLTCWCRDAGPLLITLAKTTTDQIQQALLADSGAGEFALTREFLRVCRRGAGLVVAFNDDMVMMNEHARRVLDPAAQSVLLGHAAETLAAGRSATSVVELPNGSTSQFQCRPVHAEGRLAGGILHVKLIDPVAAPVPSARFPLPGLIGSGPLWARAGQLVEAAYAAQEWLVVEGEPGTGRLTLIRAVYQRRHPGGRITVLEAGPDLPEAVRREAANGTGALVVRHIERLGPEQADSLRSVLAASPPRMAEVWVAATLDLNPDDPGARGRVEPRLLDLFARTVEVPPLRHHPEDLPDLVPFLLTRLVPDGRLRCSPEAMQVLMRYTWPGNTEQLRQVLRKVVQHRRTGTIHADDLPPECHTVSRRLLSPLESLERDAIVQSLRDADGNKRKAAKSLGVSRATIYRKIHEYGIVLPAP